MEFFSRPLFFLTSESEKNYWLICWGNIQPKQTLKTLKIIKTYTPKKNNKQQAGINLL